jgi:DNA-binding response OmpR family regulator
MQNRLLLIDGNDQAREALARQLALFGGPATAQAATVKQALVQLDRGSFDAILVEAELPEMSGGDFCWLARRRGVRTPMLVMGEISEAKIVLALESGADDYVGRPFGMSVLLARLRARLRRHEPDGGAALQLGPFIVHPGAPPSPAAKAQMVAWLGVAPAALDCRTTATQVAAA